MSSPPRCNSDRFVQTAIDLINEANSACQIVIPVETQLFDHHWPGCIFTLQATLCYDKASYQLASFTVQPDGDGLYSVVLQLRPTELYDFMGSPTVVGRLIDYTCAQTKRITKYPHVPIPR